MHDEFGSPIHYEIGEFNFSAQLLHCQVYWSDCCESGGEDGDDDGEACLIRKPSYRQAIRRGHSCQPVGVRVSPPALLQPWCAGPATPSPPACPASLPAKVELAPHSLRKLSPTEKLKRKSTDIRLQNAAAEAGPGEQAGPDGGLGIAANEEFSFLLPTAMMRSRPLYSLDLEFRSSREQKW